MIFHLEKGPFEEPFFKCVTHNFYTAEWQEQVYAGLSSIFMFVFPLIILVCAYLLTFRTLHRKLASISPFPALFYYYHNTNCQNCPFSSEGSQVFRDPAESNTLGELKRRKIVRGAKMKSLRLSVAITVTFLACWTPYYVLMMASIFNRKSVSHVCIISHRFVCRPWKCNIHPGSDRHRKN